MKATSRGERYGAGVQVGTVVVSKTSGEGEVKANQELAENMGAFFQVCRKLSSYIQQNELEKVYGDLDPEQAGLLLSAEDGKLNWKVVSGMERPELMSASIVAAPSKRCCSA